MTDLAKWPTESEAAGVIGCSVRTVQRHADAGRIEMRQRPRPGKKPENVVNPRDLEKLLPAAHVITQEWLNAPMGSHASESVALRTKTNQHQPEAAAFFTLIQTIATAIETQRGIVGKTAGKTWLSLADATEATGLSAGYLRRQIADAKILAVHGGPRGALRVQRASLEAFAG